MNHSKSNGSCRWLVPYLGRKVRQLRREENALRARISELLGQVLHLQRELCAYRQTAAGMADFWQSQSNKYFNDLIAAHKKIGGLKYLLESNGVEVPEHLK